LTGRVAVTGYCGFIGRHLCERLVNGGYDVLGLDVNDGGLDGVEHYHCDVSDYGCFKDVPSDADCLIHLAGISYIPQAESDFTMTYDVNTLGTYNTLKHSCESGIKQYIFASSAKVYGRPQYLPVDESHPTEPAGTYGRSKLHAEELVRALHAETGWSYTILRQFNIYGPGQAVDFFIPTVLNQLVRGDRLVLGNVGVKRDFLYVEDLVDAYMRFMEKGGEGLGVYNVGSGVSTPLVDVVESCARLCGRKADVEVDASRVRDDSGEVRSDIKRIKATGWKPKTDLNEGLKKTMEALG
jgi:nucleoside-diphosphate-sugar epimerase